jgi:hypothetical protein
VYVRNSTNVYTNGSVVQYSVLPTYSVTCPHANNTVRTVLDLAMILTILDCTGLGDDPWAVLLGPARITQYIHLYASATREAFSAVGFEV